MSMLATLLRKAFARARPVGGGAETHAGALEEAVECLRCDQNDRALALCLRVVEQEPQNARALYLIGSIYAQRGEYDAAARNLDHALALDPRCANAWADLGNIKRLEGANDDSLACFARALEIDPRHVVAVLGYAQLLAHAGREHEAIETLQARIVPDFEPLLLRELVNLLCRHDRFDAASLICQQALARDPRNAEAHALSGYLALVAHSDPVLALELFDQAALALPADADLSSNRGIALQQLGRFEEAIECYDRTISINPRHRAGRIHRALALLLAGDYARGWDEYEYRRLADDWAAPPMGVAEWQGEDLRSKSIYVYAEQGIGDEILFASCVPDLMTQSGRVMLECDPRLMPIFARSFPGIAVYNRAQRLSGTHSPTAVGADFMIPIGSLPRHFRPCAQSFPARRSFLCADADLSAVMRERLAALPGRLRIGISWRGGTAKTGAADRSMRLEELLSLLQVPAVSWVSVQYGDASAEIAAMRERHGICVHEFPEALADYEQTAALVCALDLVISVQTSIVNLCGALGRPVWVAAPLNPNWRYGLRTDSTPWYASVRVIRQKLPGDWTGAIVAMNQRLRLFTEGSDHTLSIVAS